MQAGCHTGRVEAKIGNPLRELTPHQPDAVDEFSRLARKIPHFGGAGELPHVQ
jgi:hypothetical protein